MKNLETFAVWTEATTIKETMTFVIVSFILRLMIDENYRAELGLCSSASERRQAKYEIFCGVLPLIENHAFRLMANGAVYRERRKTVTYRPPLFVARAIARIQGLSSLTISYTQNFNIRSPSDSEDIRLIKFYFNIFLLGWDAYLPALRIVVIAWVFVIINLTIKCF